VIWLGRTREAGAAGAGRRAGKAAGVGSWPALGEDAGAGAGEARR
jgi:hypothetical protein